jgi:hypothetical protein
MAVDREGTVYISTYAPAAKASASPEPDRVASGGAVSRLRRDATDWEKIGDFTALDFVFDDSGYLYCGTGAQGVMRSRLPLGTPSGVLPGTHGPFAWQAGPTPFHDHTAFSVDLAAHQPVSLQVFDVRGRVVSTLWMGADLPAGHNVATWQPGPRLTSGVYFYRLTVGNTLRSGSVTLIR